MNSFKVELANDRPTSTKSNTQIESRKKEIEKELEQIRKERDLERQKVDPKQLPLAPPAISHIPIVKKETGLLGGILGKLGVSNEDEDSNGKNQGKKETVKAK